MITLLGNTPVVKDNELRKEFAMSPPLTYIAYASKVALPYALKHHVLAHIRNTAYQYAMDHGITGIMLCKDGKIFHYMEGETVSMSQLMTHIRHDTMYRNITIISKGEATERRLHAWNAKCLNLTFQEKRCGIYRSTAIQKPVVCTCW